MSARTRTALVISDMRLWSKVVQQGDCWVFTGAMSNTGYGSIRRDGHAHNVHKYVYEAMVDEVPYKLVLDHLCKNKLCCNPEHLEVVTRRINTLRGTGPTALHAVKTHCPHGHEYNKANTYVRKAGGRVCRTCARGGDANHVS